MKYIANIPILDGEKTTEPGEAVDLSEEAAAPLLAIGAIAEVGSEIEGTEADTPDPKEGPAKKASPKK